MRRIAAVVVLAVVCALFFSTCAAYKAQHSGTDPNTTRNEEAAQKVEVPAAATTHFEQQPLGLKQAILIAELDKYTTELAANGKYDCCVKPGCRECVIRAGECHCRKVIDANGPCCGECTQSWIEGRGNTAGVDREKVLEHLGCVRELYEKKVPDGVQPPATTTAATSTAH
jgi:hypothetical protein